MVIRFIHIWLLISLMVSNVALSEDKSTAVCDAIDELFTREYPQKLLEDLCSFGTNPDLGFRWAGTSAEIAAGRRIQQEMTAMGLSNVRREPVPVDVFEFKKGELTVGARKMLASTFAGVSPTPPEGITAPVVYVKRGTAADFDAAGDVSGKLVLIDFWGGPKKPSFEAEFRKAAGLIFTKCPESQFRFHFNKQTLGAFDSCFELTTPPMLYICEEDGEWLKSKIKDGLAEATMLLDEEVKLRAEGGTAYNIVGELPGSSTDGQMILLTAHYDAHFRGAVDNTGGTVSMITLAKAMCDSGFRPEHKIVFMACCAEEFARVNANSFFSILGGSFWAISNSHPDWPGKVRLVINLEETNGNPCPLTIYCGGETKPWVAKLGTSYSRFLPFGKKLKTPTEFGSDHVPFIWSGIPGIEFTGSKTDEFYPRFHTNFDTPEFLSWETFTDHAKFINAAIQEVDSGLLPHDFEAKAKDLGGHVKQDQLLMAGASPFIVSKLIDSISSLERAAGRFQANRASIPAKHVDHVNTYLLKIAKVLNRGLSAFSGWKNVYPHEELLSNTLNLNTAIDSLEKNPPDSTSALKALEEIYPTSIGVKFSEAVYQRVLRRRHPDTENLDLISLGKLSVPPDVIPEYRAIERGDMGAAIVKLKGKLRLEILQLDRRLEEMISVLEAAHSLLESVTTSQSESKAIVTPAKRPVIVCKETHIYKQVGDLDIKADVFRFLDDKIRPVVVHIHGGGWMIGNRTAVGDFQYQTSIDRGSVLVSIDYRLAPQTKMPEIVKDVVDAVDWVRRVGPKKFNIDPNQVVLMGGSAGARMALMCGYMLTPPPTAIVSMAGSTGDMTGDWLADPKNRFPEFKLPTKEGALNELKLEGPEPRTSRKGSKYFLYSWLMSSHFHFMQDLFGFDPKIEPEKIFPFMPLRNVSPAFPPTILIHGDADTYVPVEQAISMAKEFEKHGVPNKLIVVKGAGHSLKNFNPEDKRGVYDQVGEWVMQRLTNLDPDSKPVQ